MKKLAVLVSTFFCSLNLLARNIVCNPEDKVLETKIEFHMNIDTNVASLSIDEENIPMKCNSTVRKWICINEKSRSNRARFEVEGEDLGKVRYRYFADDHDRAEVICTLRCQHTE